RRSSCLLVLNTWRRPQQALRHWCWPLRPRVRPAGYASDSHAHSPPLSRFSGDETPHAGLRSSKCSSSHAWPRAPGTRARALSSATSTATSSTRPRRPNHPCRRASCLPALRMTGSGCPQRRSPKPRRSCLRHSANRLPRHCRASPT
ncbi:unnamed protein product, partial [Mycena citricolor]